MPMKKQPEGIKRIPRGDRKTDADGKLLPPDEYDIMLNGNVYLGWTERMPRGRWNAHADPGGHAMLQDNHTEAVKWLLSAHEGRLRVSEGGESTEEATVTPQQADDQDFVDAVSDWPGKGGSFPTPAPAEAPQAEPVDDNLDPAFQEPEWEYPRTEGAISYEDWPVDES